MSDQLDFALDLVRRLPPDQIEENLAGLLDLCPQLTEELLSSVDQPLKIAYDKAGKRDYLLCDYNRDGDSYRSPWSNQYDPPLNDGVVPSKDLRKLEIDFNEAFDLYRDQYYEGGVASVYLWDIDGGNFALAVLFKKTQDQSKKGQPMKGSWDSIHIVEAKEDKKKKSTTYKLTSTVMLQIETSNDNTGVVNLAGSLTRQQSKDLPVNNDNTHITNIGRMVEDLESKLRETVGEIYFGKTKEVISTVRTVQSAADLNKIKNMQGSIGAALSNKH